MVKEKINFDPSAKKPYNRCLHCEKFCQECDGPRTAAMANNRWREWLRDVKKIRGLTNAIIAESSRVSIQTVERVMAANDEDVDLMRSTATSIENAVVGSSNQYPCYYAFLETVPDDTKTAQTMAAEVQKLEAALDEIHESYQRELDTVRAESQKKIDHLKNQIEYLRSVNDRNSKVIDRLLKQD